MLERTGTWLFIGVVWVFILQRAFDLSDGWIAFIAFIVGCGLNDREEKRRAKGT